MRWIKIIFWTLAVIFILWLGGFLAFMLSMASFDDQTPPPADAIVTLTGGPGRIEKALELFTLGKSTDVFVSGVHKEVSMADIRAKGPPTLPDCCITLGYMATSTEGNALEIEKWLRGSGFKSIILVTSDYHMPRALMELSFLRRQGIDIYPVATTNGQSKKSRLSLALSEYHKILFRWPKIKVLGR